LPDYFKPTEHDAARREAETWFGPPNVTVLLATQDGEPIGYLRLVVYDQPERELAHARRMLYVDQIALKDTARGRGYGKRLLEAGVGLARELGIAVVELDVHRFNATPGRSSSPRASRPRAKRLVRVLK
jgi:GNAT superfamily N-acetyltransferase